MSLVPYERAQLGNYSRLFSQDRTVAQKDYFTGILHIFHIAPKSPKFRGQTAKE